MKTSTPTRRAASASVAPRALRYNRVSKDQRQGASVDEQDIAGLAVIAREGWQDAGRIDDNDKGASVYSKGRRLGWQDVMDVILAKEIEILVVWEISRSHRDRTVWAALVAACVQAGVMLCVGGKLYDLDDPEDAFVLDLQSALGIREVAVTRKRVKRSVDRRADKGTPHGKIPYGYERIYDPMTRALVRQQPQPEQAPIVAEIVRRIATDEPLVAIARDLDVRGVPTPRGARRWGTATLRAIALSPTYLGIRTHHGEESDGIWPPLVTAAEHAAVRAVLTAPARVKKRPGSNRWLLTQIGKCGGCGDPLNARPSTAKGAALYSCSGYRGCCSTRADWLDEFVVANVCDRLADPAFRETLTAVDDTAVEIAEAEARALTERLGIYADQAADGEITAASFKRIEARLLPKIEAAEARAASGIPPVLRTLLAGRPDDPKVIARRFFALELAQRRACLRALLAELALRPKSGPRGARPTALDVDRVKLRFRGEEAA